ncbi:hypothetical protein HNR46_002963 [Haloferula luteola]|uniref:Uncharacterized protein n=1 Tax=Haloferula luteola TaxID=595692 RepID=A0A840V3X9_9BACT|nr:hypothetical protein [Haloferula luteola]MBB5352715.1 hypothetical protein [Haloferula luteola]
MTSIELQNLLSRVTPTTAEGADLLLDLRELLLSHGHPGKCVRCFFDLLGDLDQPGVLQPLRHWLEQHLEVEVTAAGTHLERLPVKLHGTGSLEDLCLRAIGTLREDRAYAHPDIRLRFCYKDAVGV